MSSQEEIALLEARAHLFEEPSLHHIEALSSGGSSARSYRHHPRIADEHSDSSDLTFNSESDHQRHEKEALHDLHDKYEEEIAAVQSDEEHYF